MNNQDELIKKEVNQTIDMSPLSYNQWDKLTKAAGYVLAKDEDFKWVSHREDFGDGTYEDVEYFQYQGSDAYVIIPNAIRGINVYTTMRMFDGGSSQSVKGVASYNPMLQMTAYMFAESKLKKLDLSYLMTENVSYMGFMFIGARIEELILKHFDTRNVKMMVCMFADSNIQYVDFSSFRTDNVVRMDSMFRNVDMRHMDITGLATHNVESMYGMFAGARFGDSSLTMNALDTSNVHDLRMMYAYTNVVFHDISNIKIPVNGESAGMFYNTRHEEGLLHDFELFDFVPVGVSVAELFYNPH